MKRKGWRKVSPEALERALELLREQVPPLWVAEELGVERSTIAKIRIKHKIAPDGEWPAIQLSVRKDSSLAALHAEIAPTVRHT